MKYLIAQLCLALLLVSSHAANTFGLIQSNDGGESWNDVTQNFRTNRVNALLVVSDHLWAGTDLGLYKSANDGIAWETTTSLKNARVLSMLYAGDVLYVGTAHGGLWISRDQGMNWSNSPAFRGVRTLVASRNNIYLGQDNGEVFVSQDRGANWRDIGKGLPEARQIFQLTTGPNGRVYAALYSKGFYELRDSSWVRLGDDNTPNPLVIITGENALLAGHNPGGIFRSADGGGSWHPVTQWLPSNAPSWTLHKFGGTIYYGTTGESGLYSSTDDGKTWRPLAPLQLRKRAVVTMATDNKKLFAATVDSDEFKID